MKATKKATKRANAAVAAGRPIKAAPKKGQPKKGTAKKSKPCNCS